MALKNIVPVSFFLLLFVSNAVAEPKFDADVRVDVIEKNVSTAKQKAIAKAMRDGLNEVVLSVSTEDSLKEFNKLNDNQLQHFISGVMVLMEKTSDVRYVANLRISVDKDILKAYMAENNLPFVVGENQEVLIVPLLETEDGRADVWSENNFWRQAFIERKNLYKGNMNIRVINKNLGNIAMVKSDRLFDMSEGEYQEFANFNRADSVYVMKYSKRNKKVYIKDYPEGKNTEADISDGDINETIDNCIAKIKDTKKVKKETLEENMVTERIDVVYSYEKLADWMRLKQQLNENPQVQDIKVISMTNGKVHFNFLYGGVVEKLQGHLEANGYKMNKEESYYAIY